MEDVYHHYDSTLNPPTVDVKVERNSRGTNYEVTVRNCLTPEAAVALATQAIELLKEKLLEGPVD